MLIVPPIVGVVSREARPFRCDAGGSDNHRCVGNVRSLYLGLHVARTGREADLFGLALERAAAVHSFPSRRRISRTTITSPSPPPP
jgi:hypothetical protein